MADHRTDAELASVALTEPEAFEALYRRYVDGVYRFALARTGSVSAAEDITSAVFMEVWGGLRRYREQGRFAAWLFTIARRRLVESQRRALRESVLDGDPGTPDRTSTVDDLASLRAAMAGLTPDRREALELRFFAGLSVREIAILMDRGESAVKMLLHRGIAQMREALLEAGDG